MSADTSHTGRLRFLATLDGLSDPQREHLLKIEDYDELCELFLICQGRYGTDAGLTKLLLRMVWSQPLSLSVDDARYRFLMDYSGDDRTATERVQGWHWCREFDGLLVGPGMGELRHCKCLVKEHPIYKTIPAELP